MSILEYGLCLSACVGHTHVHVKIVTHFCMLLPWRGISCISLSCILATVRLNVHKDHKVHNNKSNQLS